MTLILSTNLSDRIYFSSDTRITIKNKNQFYACFDNIIKVVPLNNYSNIAVAGSLEMAKYYYKKITENINQTDSINSIRNKIENIIKKISYEYYFQKSKMGSLCLMIGGIDIKSKKKIKLSKFNSMTKTYKGSMNMKEAIFQGLMGESHRQGKSKVNLPPIIELPVPDSSVFSIEISINNYKITDTEWGELLAFGTNSITKENIPSEMISLIEIDSSAGRIENDQAKIVAIMTHVVETSKNFSIGGSIFTRVISLVGSSGVLLGRVDRISLETKKLEFVNNIYKKGNRLFRKDKNGGFQRLIPFVNYKVKENFNNMDLKL